MSSKRYFALVLGGLALAACGSKNTTTGTGGSGTTTATVSASNTTGSSKVTGATTSSSASGTGGGMMGGNHSPATATMIKVNDPATAATLTAVDGQDFYSFAAKAGERIAIIAQPQQQLQAADPTVLDATVGLWDSSILANPMATPLTFQSGSWPGFAPNSSIVFVQIPKDGTYYVLVADCNGFFKSGCPNPASGVSNLDYAFVVADTAMLTNPETLASAQDGTIAKAVTVNYKASTTAGQYVDNIIGGAFQSATDTTHVFKFTPPANETVMAGSQARAEFYFQVIGSNQGGDLSASNVTAWITNADGTTVISKSDQAKHLVDSMNYSPLELSAQITPGNTYYLFVKDDHTGGTPITDFYFIDHYLNPLYDVKKNEPTAVSGPTAATSQALPAQGTAKDFYVIDGNLTTTPTPVADWYNLTIPANMTKYAFYCDSARTGSGVVGFTAALFQSDGTTPVGTAASETADADLSSGTMPSAIPAGQAAGAVWYLKLTATSQDATDTGNQYRCTVFFQK